ncbi:hypothetical protein TR67_19195 [Pseudomonas deceptionensis]|nr:hypothetical protein TR67_19195 [Pseudomonas deceptionensis]
MDFSSAGRSSASNDSDNAVAVRLRMTIPLGQKPSMTTWINGGRSEKPGVLIHLLRDRTPGQRIGSKALNLAAAHYRD